MRGMIQTFMSEIAAIQGLLLAWYDSGARLLPWRARRGQRADPYRVWLSEVMLQQTTVAHATPYFLTFVSRWPDVTALANADEDEVMAAWAGLGYYARARNLISCAKAVAAEHDGHFPDTEEDLRRLPGVGRYTAAAIAAIAFGRPAPVMDANIERVLARLYAVETPLPAAKAELRQLAAALTPAARPGDWPQALMDLGAMICRPRDPLCGRCPLAKPCRALALGDPAGFPRRTPKGERPHRHGVAYIAICNGAVGLERRPPKGLLGGMLGLPTTEWRPLPFTRAEALALAPFAAGWRETGAIEHVFTHFSLTLQVFEAKLEDAENSLAWTPIEEARQVTPSLFRKALCAP